MAMALALATPIAPTSSVHISSVASANVKRHSLKGLFRVPASSSSSSSPAVLRLRRIRSRQNDGGGVASASLESSSEGFDGPSFPTRNSTGHARLSRHFVHVLRLLATKVGQMGVSVRDAVLEPRTEEETQLLAALKGRMACAAAPILLAAVSQSVNTPLTVVASGMAKWLELYSGVLMVRVLLSWFPNIPWERQPLQAMRDMCDPYLNLFRNIIPPLFNALDLSPMLAFLVLGVLTSVLNTTVQAT